MRDPSSVRTLWCVVCTMLKKESDVDHQSQHLGGDQPLVRVENSAADSIPKALRYSYCVWFLIERCAVGRNYGIFGKHLLQPKLPRIVRKTVQI